MNKNFIIGYLFYIIFILISCDPGMTNNNQKELVKIKIYSTGNYSETYIINIYNTGKLHIQYGKGGICDNGELMIKKKYKEKTILLNSNELDRINELIKKVDKLGDIERKIILKGGWEIFITTQKSYINFYLNKLEEKERPLREFVKTLFELSPIKIDIHSWS